MQINITGHHIDLTPALKTFTQEKFDKLERHCEHITSINVVLDVEKKRQIAEATVYITKAELHACSESEDLYSAIETLISKLKRQLSKHKYKFRTRENN